MAGVLKNGWYSNFGRNNLMRFLWLLFFLYSKSSLAQSLLWDETSGKIYFTEEVPAKDAPVTDLYTRAKIWLKLPELNNNSIEEKKPVNILFGYKFIFLPVVNTGQTREIKINYTVRIEMEDDRFWFRFSDFEVENYENGKTENKSQPLEKLLIKKTNPDAETQFQKDLKKAFLQEINNQIISLKKALL